MILPGLLGSVGIIPGPTPPLVTTYATWDTTVTHGGTITFANPLQFTAGAPSRRIVPANMGKTAGRWYYEITGISATNNSSAGAWPANATLLDYLGDSNSPFSLGWYQPDYYKGAGAVGMGGTHTDLDVMGFLIDLDARTMDFYLNGTHLAQTSLPGSAGPLWFPAACAVDQPVTMRANFGPALAFPEIPINNAAKLGWYTGPDPSAAAGTPWTGHDSANTATNLFSICHNGTGTLVAVGGYNAGFEVMYSTDHGVTWTAVAETISANYWSAVCWSGSNFVAVSTTGKCMTSPTGLAGTWTTRTLANGNTMRGIASNGAGIVVAVAYDGGSASRVQYSADHGVTWADKNPGATSTWISVAYGGGYFIMGSDTGFLRNSTDGQTWNTCTPATSSPTVYALAYNGTNTWILCGHSGAALQVAHSTDNGATWTAHSVPTDTPWNGACWGGTGAGGVFVIVGTASGGVTANVATSPDGITWTNQTAGVAGREWRAVTYDGTSFVAVSYDTASGDVMTAP